MKPLNSLLIFLSVILTASSFSLYAMPVFPMAFYGVSTIDGVAAPVGTSIRAYDASSTLLGEVTLTEAGVYGYDNALKQKLIIKEGKGAITFTFKTATKNNNEETTGSSTQMYASFISGVAVQKDLAFTVGVATIAPTTGGGGGSSGGVSSSGGGSSGGGGGYSGAVSSGGNVTTTQNQQTTQPTASTPYATKNVTTTIQSGVATTTTVTFTKTLTVGVKDKEVLALQKILVKEKLLIAGNATGYFGPATQKALKAWQKKNKISQTGILNKTSRDILMKRK